MSARRAQLLSLDAMVSLVIVIFVFTAVLNTSSALKEEITSMLGWYERANIADNMLDIMIKTPGEPANWYQNPGSVKIVGLRSDSSLTGVDYKRVKALALNFNNGNVSGALNNMGTGKDFLLEFYISSFQVSIGGRFPRVYMQNMTFSNPRGTPPGINFEISSGGGNNPITVSYIELTRDGRTYINNSICSLVKGNTLDLKDGDKLKFVLSVNATLTAKRGQYNEVYNIPSGTVVELYITGPDASNFKLNYGGGSCPFTFNFTGNGNVVVTVSAYDNTTPKISSTYTLYTSLMEKKTPIYWFAVINGTPTQDRNSVLASMDRSPWVEPAERRITIARLEYNLSAGPSATDPMVYGLLTSPLPPGAYLSVSATSNTPGNATFVALSGSRLLGLMVYRDKTGGILRGVLVENRTSGVVLKYYSGTASSISIPLKDIFGEGSGMVLGLWFYSLNGWARSGVSINIVPSIEWSLKPKAEPALVKLTVWDDS
ncbi:hypothetical protein [Thermococcus zilligii]|uniref:hypothetical protein n=1 Tax=Thermococcus zilligii TaxID=54076 RepID=UPI00029A1F4C|nr:hypothetical protein [Thermococcus zilligii]